MSDDYQRGYDQALSEAAASVEAMDRKLRNAEGLVLAMVRAAGGSLFVSHSDIVNSRRFDLVQDENLRDNGWDFSVRCKD